MDVTDKSDGTVKRLQFLARRSVLCGDTWSKNFQMLLEFLNRNGTTKFAYQAMYHSMAVGAQDSNLFQTCKPAIFHGFDAF